MPTRTAPVGARSARTAGVISVIGAHDTTATPTRSVGSARWFPRPGSRTGAAAPRPVTDRGARAGVLGMHVGRLRRLASPRGKRLGRRAGRDQALTAAADEIAPAGLDQGLVHQKPVGRLEKLHERALRPAITQFLDRV